MKTKRYESTPGNHITGPLLGRLCELLEAVRKLQTDAQVYGLAGATNAPSVRCEVKGLTLGHFYEIEKAMDALVGPNTKTTDAEATP